LGVAGSGGRRRAAPQGVELYPGELMGERETTQRHRGLVYQPNGWSRPAEHLG